MNLNQMYSLLNIGLLALSKRTTSIGVVVIPIVTGDTTVVNKGGTSVVARENIASETQPICDTENNP
jgi:hypothetical protein